MGKKKSKSSKKKPAALRDRELPLEKLRVEQDFLKYMKLLKLFAKKYCVMIAASDTPVGPATTREMTGALMEMGLRIDLYGKYRCAYAAMIDAGRVVFEELKSDEVKAKVRIGQSEVELVSRGFNAGDKKGSIRINGKECSPNIRGLNIVVYDRTAGAVLDATNFDTYSEAASRFLTNRDAQILKRFADTHPDVLAVLAKFSTFPTAPVTDGERFILENKVTFEVILQNLHQHVFTLHQYFDEAEIAEVLSIPKSYFDSNGVRRFEDRHGKHINISGGHRETAYQPDQFQRTIFLFGGCTVFGIGSDDSRTVASYLQMQCNENTPEAGIVVQNYGYCLGGTEATTDEYSKILEHLPVKQGDVVIYFTPAFSDNEGFPCIDLTEMAEKPRDYDVFIDTIHYSPDGNRLIAEKLFDGLLTMGVLGPFDHAKTPPAQETQNNYGFDREGVKELTEYKKLLTDWYQETFSLTIGSVVMNCNPFTLGHRYLIEKALEQCDYLIIFVVQEDQSDFPFEDRMKLVGEGVQDLKNVAVLPSGRFVLSSLTFSEYFNKSELQDRTIDTSLDVTVFAREIAPCLHITKRFAGEEPFDTVTRQYNETMRRILPEYGIEFVEFPRKTDVRGGDIYQCLACA